MKPETVRSGRGSTALNRRRFFVACGILSSLLYIAMNIFVPMRYNGYNSFSQTISELSAVGAPTSTIWVVLGIVYTLLVAMFGWGIWLSGRQNAPLRSAGAFLIVYGLVGLGWPLAPMHQREVIAAGGGTISDTMHIVFSFLTVILMLLAIGFAAPAFGKRFRLYSIITIVLLLGFGILTSLDAPKLEANLPTPWIGVWERICIGVYMLWSIVLSTIVLRRSRSQAKSYSTKVIERDVEPRRGFKKTMSREKVRSEK